MIGDGYWAIGITVTYRSDRRAWGAHLIFRDNGWVGDDAPDQARIVTEGTLGTRYHVENGQQADALTAVIDAIRRDADRLGIRFRTDMGGPTLYVQGDGEATDVDLPAHWRELLAAQCARLGWRDVYQPDAIRPQSRISDPAADAEPRRSCRICHRSGRFQGRLCDWCRTNVAGLMLPYLAALLVIAVVGLVVGHHGIPGRVFLAIVTAVAALGMVGEWRTLRARGTRGLRATQTETPEEDR